MWTAHGTGTSRLHVKNFMKQLMSPFSEDDSIEELAAQLSTSRTSSTPIKVRMLT